MESDMELSYFLEGDYTAVLVIQKAAAVIFPGRKLNCSI